MMLHGKHSVVESGSQKMHGIEKELSNIEPLSSRSDDASL